MIKQLEESKISESLYCSNGSIYEGSGDCGDTAIADVRICETLNMWVLELTSLNNILWADDIISLAEWIKTLPESK